MSNLTPAYAEWPTSQSSAMAHAGLMGVAWVFLLPSALVCSLSGSRYTLLVQSLFVATNLIALCFGSYYTHSTPDLYKGHIHRGVGWIALIAVTAHLIISFITRRRSKGSIAKVHTPVRGTLLPKWLRASRIFTFTRSRANSEVGGDATPVEEENLEGLLRDSAEIGTDGTLTEVDPEVAGEDCTRLQDVPLEASEHMRTNGRRGRQAKVAAFARTTVKLLVPIVGFVAFMSGLVVYAGVFRGNELWNGLSYVLKGSIFCCFGIFTFLRWIGCLSSRGWAWNGPAAIDADEKNVPFTSQKSAEFVESLTVLTYGLLSTLLELVAGGNEPTSDGLMTSILLCATGACGLLLELPSIQRQLRRTSRTHYISTHSSTTFINPLPLLAVLTAGLISISRQPETKIERQMDVQWGWLAIGFAVARLATYVVQMMRPRDDAPSVSPPSELVASYCILTGGFTLMISTRGVLHVLDILSVAPSSILASCSAVTLFVMGWAAVLVVVMRH